ncbi:MAG: hypothetical protein K0B15_04665 [Lentimicrobium sp.]|nr:hypothetical protein [Lentimicrobium sp.]
MKKHLKFTRWLAVLLLLVAGTGAMAQETGPQEVCPGPQNYWVVPDSPSNTFTWTISPATGWTIAQNGNAYTVIITWANVTVPTDYTITLKEDNLTCYTEVDVLVTVYPQPEVPAISVTQPTCALPSGTITVTSPLGANYEYSIDGGTTWQASPNFGGIAPGTYNITVKNEYDCTNISGDVTINVAPEAPEAPVASLIQPTCAVPTGTITIVAPIGNYEYSIDGTNWQTTLVFAGLAPNLYTVSVRNVDDITCVSTSQYTINVAPEAPEAPVASITQPTCDEATGTITITSPVGATYEYSIDGGAIWQTSPIFGSLISGPYTIFVRSTVDISCQSSSDFVINPQPPAPTTSPIYHN